MKYRIPLIFSAVGLAGCVSAPPQQTTPPPTPAAAYTYAPHKLTSAEVAAVQAGVKRMLKDPDSARFRDFVAVNSSSTTATVCGYVNAKNSFGGYTGDTPFVGLLIIGKKLSFLNVVPKSSDDQTTRSVCAKYGITLL